MAPRPTLNPDAAKALEAQYGEGAQRAPRAGKRRVFQPSPQQADFLDWVEYGQGSCLLEAVAGAGKTTTLVQALLRMEGKVFFGAYNKKIAQEIKAKAKEARADRPGVFISTMHGAGFSHWTRVAPKCNVDDRKVGNIVKEMIRLDESVRPYAAFINKMVSFGKQYLVGAECAMDSPVVWNHIREHYGTDDLVADGDISRAMLLMLEAYQRSADQVAHIIDFDDMIFAPIYKKVRFFQNDWVLIDECQDVNPARRRLARLMLKPQGRLVAVGDNRQAIYGFTGAGSDAVERISETFKCKRMPLTVTYRCPKAVVRHAQQWVSHIQAHPSAPEGVVRAVAPAKLDEQGQPVAGPWFMHDRPSREDAVLCRYTRPLVQTAFAMLKAGIACRIEGRDIGKNLAELAQRWRIKTLEKLDERLGTYLENELAKDQPDSKKQAVEDMVGTLRVFLERMRALGKRSIAELVADIESLFADEVNGVVVLSTGHKAKGREWPRVYWIQAAQRIPNLMDWELVQEDNLKYVICTRAQSELVLVPEGL